MEIRYIMTVVFILCTGFLVTGIGRSIAQMKQAQDRLHQAQEKVQSLRQEQQQLVSDKNRQASAEFIESQIRNKLKLVKPGETLVIVPHTGEISETEQVYKYRPGEDTHQSESQANYQKWAALFF